MFKLVKRTMCWTYTTVITSTLFLFLVLMIGVKHSIVIKNNLDVYRISTHNLLITFDLKYFYCSKVCRFFQHFSHHL